MDELKPDVSSAMNGALCAFAMRWELDGDYIRCRQCTSPQLTTYSDREFLHHPGCKAAGTVETHPWRTYLELLAPLIAAWNTRAASGGLNEPFGNPEQLASLEQRARRLGQLAEPPYLIQPSGCRYTPQEVGRMLANRVVQPHYAEWLVHKAITAALANRQGVGGWRPIEAAPKDGEIILLADISEVHVMVREARWDAMAGKWAWPWYCGIEPTVWMPLPPSTQPAGDVGSQPTSKSVARRLAVQRGVGREG